MQSYQLPRRQSQNTLGQNMPSSGFLCPLHITHHCKFASCCYYYCCFFFLYHFLISQHYGILQYILHISCPILELSISQSSSGSCYWRRVLEPHFESKGAHMCIITIYRHVSIVISTCICIYQYSANFEFILMIPSPKHKDHYNPLPWIICKVFSSSEKTGSQILLFI